MALPLCHGVSALSRGQARHDEVERVLAAALDDLLGAWHRWQQRYRFRHGYPSTSAGTQQYLCSTQYDAENGTLDANLHNRTMRSVDFQVSELGEPHRSAIYCNARCIAVGGSVFRHPRLPSHPIEALMVISEARDMLSVRLEKCGVI